MVACDLFDLSFYNLNLILLETKGMGCLWSPNPHVLFSFIYLFLTQINLRVCNMGDDQSLCCNLG